MAARDIVALVNTLAVPVEVLSIMAALAITGRTLTEQGAEVVLAVLGGQVAATVGYLVQNS